MLALVGATTALLLAPGVSVHHPVAPSARHSVSPVCGTRAPFRSAPEPAAAPELDASGTKRMSRFAPIREFMPGARYRKQKSGDKFYSGRNQALLGQLGKRFRDVKNRKVVVITGSSSGLGFYAVQDLLKNREGYYVVAAVRDPEKMDAAAEEAGISKEDYVAMELQYVACDTEALPSRLSLARSWKILRG
jgi:hypothetical protein